MCTLSYLFAKTTTEEEKKIFKGFVQKFLHERKIAKKNEISFSISYN